MFGLYFCLRRMLQMEKFAHFYCVCPMFILRRLCTCTSRRRHTRTHRHSATLGKPLPHPAISWLSPLPLPVYFSVSLFSPVSSVRSSVSEDVWPLTIHCGQGDTVHWLSVFSFLFCTAQCHLCCTAVVTHRHFIGHDIKKKKKHVHKSSDFDSAVARVSHNRNLSCLCMCA